MRALGELRKPELRVGAGREVDQSTPVRKDIAVWAGFLCKPEGQQQDAERHSACQHTGHTGSHTQQRNDTAGGRCMNTQRETHTHTHTLTATPDGEGGPGWVWVFMTPSPTQRGWQSYITQAAKGRG